MGAAVLLSLCVHGGLLLQPIPPQPIPGNQATQGIALEIIQPAPHTPHSPAAAPAARTGIDPTPAVAHHTIARQRTAPATTPESLVSKPMPIEQAAPTRAAAPTYPAPDTASAAAPDAASSNPLLAQIKTNLARHFHYPRIARQRGWEGEVILGFILNADGRITTIKVLKSSGFLLLDQAARQSLARVERLQLASQHIAGNNHLELPVQYRLTDI